jgi:hypothetical protein
MFLIVGKSDISISYSRMNNVSYGVSEQNVALDEIDRHLENLQFKGFSILPNLIPTKTLPLWRSRIDEVYQTQESEFGIENLKAINEVDNCRAPLLYDFKFTDLATIPLVIEIVERFFGEWGILHLQNAVINRPTVTHHQSSWHRDLPHQNFVISKPLALSCLVAIDDFTSETGGTIVLPYSHKSENFPSPKYIEDNFLQVEMNAGSALIFDSMLFHKTGTNKSQTLRRGVNHVYTAPILKQQYDFSKYFADQRDHLPSLIKRLFGFSSKVAVHDREWRSERLKRIKGLPK